MLLRRLQRRRWRASCVALWCGYLRKWGIAAQRFCSKTGSCQISSVFGSHYFLACDSWFALTCSTCQLLLTFSCVNVLFAACFQLWTWFECLTAGSSPPFLKLICPSVGFAWTHFNSSMAHIQVQHTWKAHVFSRLMRHTFGPFFSWSYPNSPSLALSVRFWIPWSSLTSISHGPEVRAVIQLCSGIFFRKLKP